MKKITSKLFFSFLATGVFCLSACQNIDGKTILCKEKKIYLYNIETNKRKLVCNTIYKYDSKNNLVKESDSKTHKITYEYSKDSLLLNKKEYFCYSDTKNLHLSYETQYTYDERNNLTSEAEYYVNDNGIKGLCNLDLYTYNEQNLMTEHDWGFLFDKEGNEMFHKYEKIEYDSNGLIQKIVTNVNGLHYEAIYKGNFTVNTYLYMYNYDELGKINNVTLKGDGYVYIDLIHQIKEDKSYVLGMKNYYYNDNGLLTKVDYCDVLELKYENPRFDSAEARDEYKYDSNNLLIEENFYKFNYYSEELNKVKAYEYQYDGKSRLKDEHLYKYDNKGLHYHEETYYSYK